MSHPYGTSVLWVLSHLPLPRPRARRHATHLLSVLSLVGLFRRAVQVRVTTAQGTAVVYRLRRAAVNENKDNKTKRQE